MNAPDPVYDDWSEYEVRTVDGEDLLFRNKRRCGTAQLLTCLWAILLWAFLAACSLTIIILVI